MYYSIHFLKNQYVLEKNRLGQIYRANIFTKIVFTNPENDDIMFMPNKFHK